MATLLWLSFADYSVDVDAGQAPEPPVEEAAAAGVGGNADKEPPGKGGGSTTTMAASAGGGDAASALLEGRPVPVTRVENSGAGAYKTPVVVPPGTNGVQPNLSFVYNSQSQQNGLLGIH